MADETEQEMPFGSRPGILFNKNAEWAISKVQLEGRHSLYAIYDALRNISGGINFGNLYTFL